MQSRSQSRRMASRGEVVLRRAEQVPQHLVTQLVEMTVPNIQRTPVGAQPSRWLQGVIAKIGKYRFDAWGKLMAVLKFRIVRGEDVAQVTAPLYLAAATLEAWGCEAAAKDDLDALFDLDELAECQSRIASRHYEKHPSVANAQRVAELECVEQSLSRRIIALAARREI